MATLAAATDKLAHRVRSGSTPEVKVFDPDVAAQRKVDPQRRTRDERLPRTMSELNVLPTTGDHEAVT